MFLDLKTSNRSRIVCLMLAWLGAFQLWLPAQEPARTNVADLAIVNAKILICDTAMSQASAIAVQSGRIVAVGDRSTVEPFVSKATQVLDAAGRTVTPGLIDSHLHFINLGQSLQEKQLGSLELGKRADIVLWDTDLLNCKPAAILTANVAFTILEGKIVYTGE